MNTIRDAKIRVQDYTSPEPRVSRGVLTVTDSGLLYEAFRAPRTRLSARMRLRRLIGLSN